MNLFKSFRNFVKNAFTPDLQGFITALAIDKVVENNLDLFNHNLEHLVNLQWVDNLVVQEAPQCRKEEWLALDNNSKAIMVGEVRTSAYLWLEGL